MSRSMKTVIASVAAATFMFTTACTPGGGGAESGAGADGAGGGSSSEINLLVPTYSDATKGLWEGIIADFEKENPDIKVNLEVQSWENINQVVTTKIQNDQAPDILNIDSFTAYAGDDLLYPAADVVSPETLEKFPENFRQNASTGGTQYGLPLIASGRALFYNTELFEKAGIAAPPKNWDELEKAAMALKALDGVDGYGMPLGSEEAQAETAIWFYGAGGGYGDDKTITLNSAANIEAATFMKKLIDEGATQPNAGSSQRTPLGQVFFQGKIGMVIGLPPYIKKIQEQNPNLKYAIAPIPTKDGTPFTLGVADHLMAFNNDDGAKKESIKKFLDFFYSDAQYTKFVSTEKFIPATTSALEALKDDPTIKDFVPLMADAKFYPFTNAKWQAAQGVLQSEIGKLAQEGTDPAQLLADLQAKVDAQ